MLHDLTGCVYHWPGGRHHHRVSSSPAAPAPPDRYPPVPEPLPPAGPGPDTGPDVGVVDDHTHLDALPDHEVDALLAAAAAAGVPRAVQIGCDLPGARWTAAAVTRWPQLLGGVAIHPNEAPLLAARGRLDAALAEVEALASSTDRIRVIGETGMDAVRTDLGDPAALAAQRESFARHVDLAKRLDLTLQIHDRETHALVLDVLAAEGAPARTVFHCFSGDADLARRCAAQGWFLSFAGTITFKNAGALREALAAVPLTQVQVETDAPHLTPVPHRGRPNASHLLPHTVRAVAAVLDRDARDVADILTTTSSRLYGSWRERARGAPTDQ